MNYSLIAQAAESASKTTVVPPPQTLPTGAQISSFFYTFGASIVVAFVLYILLFCILRAFLRRTEKDVVQIYENCCNDIIFICPGFLAIANPKLNTANDTIWIELMRTSFTFKLSCRKIHKIMKIGLVELPELKIINSGGTNCTQQSQYSLCDRILYGCKETLFNQLV
ncbi:hypothetical protein [Nostoc sp. C117]|uniref:hypothetical protein n=1 Tax=Nostoc sp. C117 TaxID=3349875 RepID=UPI00370D8546